MKVYHNGIMVEVQGRHNVFGHSERFLISKLKCGFKKQGKELHKRAKEKTHDNEIWLTCVFIVNMI